MGKQFFIPGDNSGFQYDNKRKLNEYSENVPNGNMDKNKLNEDVDLIIEDNTVYEVDRDCYERLKKIKKRK